MLVICFISQWMKRSKHELFFIPPKETLIWRRHCSIGKSYCNMTSKRTIDWLLESFLAYSPERSLNQAKATGVCIRSINQTNRSISVRIRLLLLFCSRFFVSRSYENRSNNFRALFLGTLIQSFRIQLQKKLPTFDELNEMELARLSLRQRKFTL